MRSGGFSANQVKAANKRQLVASLSRGNSVVAAELRLLLKLEREPGLRPEARSIYCR